MEVRTERIRQCLDEALLENRRLLLQVFEAPLKLLLFLLFFWIRGNSRACSVVGHGRCSWLNDPSTAWGKLQAKVRQLQHERAMPPGPEAFGVRGWKHIANKTHKK